MTILNDKKGMQNSGLVLPMITEDKNGLKKDSGFQHSRGDYPPACQNTMCTPGCILLCEAE